MSLTDVLLIVLVFLAVVGFLLLYRLAARRPKPDLDPLLARFEAFEKGQEKGERALRDELSRNREESLAQGRSLREEMTGGSRASTTP